MQHGLHPESQPLQDALTGPHGSEGDLQWGPQAELASQGALLGSAG